MQKFWTTCHDSFTSVYGGLSLNAMLSKVSAFGIEQLEFGSGAWPGNPASAHR